MNEFSLKRHPPLFWALLIAIATLSFLGNVFKYELFFGVDFLFGSIGSLFAIALLGPQAGVGIATLAASYTLFLWNHPFGFLVLVGEALFVARTLPRFRYNIALSSLTYWILIGGPLIFLTYRFYLGMEPSGAGLAAVKQAANGVVNAVLVSLLLTPALFPGFIRNHLSRFYRRQATIFHTLFNIVSAAVIIPLILFIISDVRGVVNRIEDGINLRLDTISMGVSASVDRWIDQHVNVAKVLARAASDFGFSDTQALQKITDETRQTWPDVLTIYIADEKGDAFSFSPPINARGESTVGLNFGDRAYFKAVETSLQTVVSGVFPGRGGVDSPVVTVNQPIFEQEKFVGLASVALDLNGLTRLLKLPQNGNSYFATLVDPNGKVIASNQPELGPLQLYNERKPGQIINRDRGFFQRWPTDGEVAPMSQWEQSFLGRDLTLENIGHWRLLVEIPLSQWQSFLYEEYIRSLSLVLAVAGITVLASSFIATRITKPLAELSNTTTNLPGRLESGQAIQWPTSPFSELTALTSNFQITTAALKNRFDDLEKSIRVKDEFLAVLSHELRTPLNIIQGYLDLLGSEDLNEESLEYVEVALRNANLLTALIQDLLDASRIDTGKIVLEKSAVDLRQLSQQAIDSVRLAANAKQIALKFLTSPNSEPCDVYGDPARINQVLWNLLSNSIKFTPAGGTIDVSVFAENEDCVIQVRDSGEGIHPEFIPFIFNRFVQEDGTVTRKHGGLGLGLFIVRQLVELHGGTIRAHSLGRDTGSTMTVRIPRLRETPKETHSSCDSPLNN